MTPDEKRRPEQSSSATPRKAVIAAAVAPAVEQKASELEQTASEADQTVSDLDQTASDRDQAQSEADQRTSNRDQAAADQERASRRPQTEPDSAYEAARAERRAGTYERAETGQARADTAADRVDHAEMRDEHARVRDSAAEQRDRAAVGLDGERESSRLSSESPRDRASRVRATAASNRARAAADRERAAADRAAAARDRDLARAELEQAQAQKMEAVGELAGGIAHEFSSLLMIVSGYARVLATRVDVAAAQEDAEQIIVAADRAAELTRQLLTFAHLNQTSPTLLDPSREIADLESTWRGLASDPVQVQFVLDRVTHPIVIDRAEFAEIITNLIRNASDAMPGGGTITITSEPWVADEPEVDEPELESATDAPGHEPGDYAVVSVSDTGVGIPPEVRERMFEPFFTTTRPQGSGMGLATVYAIVDQAGGWIEVQTQVGEGTTFKVMLPAAVTPVEPDPEAGMIKVM